MKITKEQFNSLPQLDRIEYGQGVLFCDNTFLHGILFFMMAIVVAFNGNVFSVVFYVFGIWFVIRSIKSLRKLEQKYFKVVKK